jgi:hypothetical protein
MSLESTSFLRPPYLLPRINSVLELILTSNRFCGIDAYAENFEQYMGARNRVGIGLSYRPARLLMLVVWYDNSVPTWFLAPIDSRVENLNPAMGREINSRNRVWN